MRAHRARALGTVALALAASALVATAALAASLNFSEPPSSPELVGDAPHAVVAGDWNGDGASDLAVANQGPGNVTILRNTGTGNFREPAWSPEPAAGGAESLAAADFDGDGDLDIAVANSFANNVTILRNNGSGKFRQPSSSPVATGLGPFSIAAADLDGDGDKDLATANDGSDNVTILRNNGSGKFRQPSSSPEQVGHIPVAVAAADLDGDGDQDLAVANQGLDNVTILKNKGGGDFTEPASSPVGAGDAPSSIAAADLDGDADRDLAVANAFSADVTILLNKGTGRFHQPASSPEPAGDRARSVVAADFNGDGAMDLAVANAFVDDITILRNNGAARFGEPASSPEAAGDFPYSLATADLDGDLDQDLAAANANSDNVTILKNR